jgi:hypothetical protein
MTEAEKKREEILQFLLAWDAEQMLFSDDEKRVHTMDTLGEPDDADPVVRALSYFPRVSLH